ncbi:hypothetical protein M0811_11627 [Anaeramoeba ignava]|uniref:Uncharacterized protein n=1 Tax=Anaeramoeba ignava TaxID=1746090 RepID=A0A9Q0LBQ7_ANAIG|nr:hypothetical protein M0811_11627 [Anaeramoeba ignava]
MNESDWDEEISKAENNENINDNHSMKLGNLLKILEDDENNQKFPDKWKIINQIKSFIYVVKYQRPPIIMSLWAKLEKFKDFLTKWNENYNEIQKINTQDFIKNIKEINQESGFLYVEIVEMLVYEKKINEANEVIKKFFEYYELTKDLTEFESINLFDISINLLRKYATTTDSASSFLDLLQKVQNIHPNSNLLVFDLILNEYNSHNFDEIQDIGYQSIIEEYVQFIKNQKLY